MWTTLPHGLLRHWPVEQFTLKKAVNFDGFFIGSTLPSLLRDQAGLDLKP